MTGGDSLTQNLNVFYDAGDIAWMITATALVLLMIPGVGFVHTPYKPLNSNLSQLLLFGSGTSKICLISDMALDLRNCPHIVSMVLLGLLTRILSFRRQIPWKFGEFRFQKRTGGSFSWLTTYPRSDVRCLPGHVRLHHCRIGHRCCCRKRKTCTSHGFWIHLVNHCLRSNCLLDMEQLWMGIQTGWT